MNYKLLRKFFREAKNTWIYGRSTILIMRILEEHPDIQRSDILYYANIVKDGSFVKIFNYLLKNRYIVRRHNKYRLSRRGKRMLNKIRRMYSELLGIEYEG